MAVGNLALEVLISLCGKGYGVFEQLLASHTNEHRHSATTSAYESVSIHKPEREHDTMLPELLATRAKGDAAAEAAMGNGAQQALSA